MSFPELAVVFVIALLVLGPERLPQVAREVGRWVSRARRTANELRYLLEREIAHEDVGRKDLDESRQPGSEDAQQR